MQNLKFKQLIVLSNSEKAGNRFQFQDRLNLIKASDNNVGKSTIVKLLFWTLGCEVSFDTTWENLDCKAIVVFEIANKEYSAFRYKDRLVIKDAENKIESFDKITGSYAERLAEIFQFKALLPNRNETELETPPPAYYFLPFYIDQKKSWTKPWDSFEKLAQYNNWKPVIVKYHTGLISPLHFDLEKEKYSAKNVQKSLNTEIDRLGFAVSIVEEYTPQILNTITVDQVRFKEMTDEIKEDLFRLANEQEKALDQYAKLESEKANLANQYSFAKEIVKELELDYKFSVENIHDDEIECPVCGTVHENSVIQRASLLVDKQQAELQLSNLEEKMEKISSKSIRILDELEKIRSSISAINDKYFIDDEGKDRIDFIQIIEGVAGASIKEKVNAELKENLLSAKNVGDTLKDISKSQRNLLSKKHTSEITAFFSSTFTNYASMLNTEEVNLSSIKTPLDYNKVVKEGGAAENVRVTLAYNLAVYSTVLKYGNSVRSALVLDTPNQHEQSNTNYTSIINLLLQYFSKGAQVILCAMDNEHLTPYEKEAHIIRLTSEKILSKEMFNSVKADFIPYE